MCRRRSERIGEDGPRGLLSGRGRGDGDTGFGSPNSNKSAREARGHHTQRRVRERAIAAGPGAILRNHLDSVTSPDASASRRASVRPFGVIGGEFDPGSGSTLAACLMHASRARTSSGVLRGGRVRNTWATCPGVGDSRGKPRVIPHTLLRRSAGARKALRRRPWRGLRPISWLVG